MLSINGVCESSYDNVRSTTKQQHLILAIDQARRFSLFGHIALMSDKTERDVKILTASPLENWRRPPYYVDVDYPARPEIR